MVSDEGLTSADLQLSLMMQILGLEFGSKVPEHNDGFPHKQYHDEEHSPTINPTRENFY